MFLSRRWRTVISLFLIIIFVFSMCLTSYAAMPLVIVGVEELIAAVLTACGIKMVSQVDFERLCVEVSDSVKKLANFDTMCRMKMLGAVTYVEAFWVNEIVKAASRLQAFNPVPVSTAIYAGGLSYPYVGSYATIDDLKLSGAAHQLPVLYQFEPLKVGSTTVPVDIFKNAHLHLQVGYQLFNDGYGDPYFCCSDMEQPPFSGRQGSTVVVGHLVTSKSALKIFSPCVAMLGGTLRLMVFHEFDSDIWVNIHYMTAGGKDFTLVPSISADMPWDVTGSLPSVSADGTIALPEPWSKTLRDIAGVGCLPLSVPGTIADIGALTQADAQSGTKTQAMTDVAVDDFVKKGALSLTLADFFPFCIPFDIVKGIKLLVAPSKAPVFDIPIQLPYIGDSNIRVDLTQYAGIASISRWFLTFVFVIGLAAGTGKVMKW